MTVHWRDGRTAPAKLTTEPEEAGDGEAVLYLGGEIHLANVLPEGTIIQVRAGEGSKGLQERGERAGYNCTTEPPE